MKTLFFLALIMSACYLFYQESPRLAGWIDGAPFAIETLGDELKKEIDDGIATAQLLASSAQEMDALKHELAIVKAKQQALQEWLPAAVVNKHSQTESEKTVLIVEPKVAGTFTGMNENTNEQNLQTEVVFEKSPQVVTQKREALLSIAQRMELRALDLVEQ